MMKHVAMGLLLLSSPSLAMTSKVSAPSPSPSPTPTDEVGCGRPDKPLVTLSKAGPSVDVGFATRALCHINRVATNGCLESRVKAHVFKSLHGVVEPALAKSQADQAWARFTAGAPYDLELRWYVGKCYPVKGCSKVVGYTYNYWDDNKALGTEKRIWSNTRQMTDERAYAAHLTHELSHQARAGGFVHYTVHTGSFPYDVGTLAGECIQ